MSIHPLLTADSFLGSRKFTPGASSPVAVYFSAHWCPPCRGFTPRLVEFYIEAQKIDPGFEIVFVSLDKSEREMKTYINEAAMPWLVLPFDDDRKEELLQYCGQGIPCLVVFDAQGNEINKSGRDVVPHGPKHCLDLWKKGAKGASSSADAFSIGPATGLLIVFAAFMIYRYVTK